MPINLAGSFRSAQGQNFISTRSRFSIRQKAWLFRPVPPQATGLNLDLFLDVRDVWAQDTNTSTCHIDTALRTWGNMTGRGRSAVNPATEVAASRFLPERAQLCLPIPAALHLNKTGETQRFIEDNKVKTDIQINNSPPRLPPSQTNCCFALRNKNS